MSITETPMPPYPWQAELWQGFCDNVQRARVPHAILLHGVEGVGVESLALSMARYLLCQSTLEDVACGRCRSCQLLHVGTHPDLFFLKREEDAAQIKVDQVRECVGFVSKTPYANGPKVVLVEHADAMNVNAANALLKSLEEPQGQTVFILTTNRTSAILPTIRSRCRALTVNIPSTEAAQAWLSEQGLGEQYHLLVQSGGAPVLVKQWLESDFLDIQKQVHESLLALLSHQSGAVQIGVKWQKLALDTVVELQLQVLEASIKSKYKLGATAGSEEASSSIFSILDRIHETYLFRLRDKLVSKLTVLRSSANLNAAMASEELAMDWIALAGLAGRR